VGERWVRCTENVAQLGEKSNASLVGNPKGNRPLGSPRHRWEDKIKMDLKEI
jgi:hypothetical protein